MSVVRVAVPLTVLVAIASIFVYFVFFWGSKAEGRLVLTLGDQREVFKAKKCMRLPGGTISVTSQRDETGTTSYPHVSVDPLGNRRYRVSFHLDARHDATITSGPDGKLSNGKRCKKFKVLIDEDQGHLDIDCPVVVTLTGAEVAPEKKEGTLQGSIQFTECSKN